MKKISRFVLLLAIFNFQFSIFNSAQAQQCYWVFMTDKAGTTFDPYSYFDAKAIERYRINEADLYDISNYPVNESYVSQVEALATEGVGESRWFNAAAVVATPEQVAAIKKLPFVKEVVAIESNMHLASREDNNFSIEEPGSSTEQQLHDQLIRMGGKYFRDKGINGKGIRIAVFDGGFPQVNTHAAFKHLRDNKQIVKTWNFPNKKENVYGWNSHGLMTLSCIAGRYDEMDLGLATGAELLLARTEVNTEPFKEEVWWQMAVEWADKNGANIISSSLGYGKDRYYTKDMNGQSYVAKAGNMAARKGILVCNSAGNEGDDETWYTIITPSDADSVLCVGGIMPDLESYNRTSFSSYGPSADGRQKPNVCAFAYAWTANTGKSNHDYHTVPGTSFSCPLVSGFAACAMQCRPGIKTMDLFHEIEISADLYPYCDYTYGYGVPQADFFTGDRKEVKPTFTFEQDYQNGHVRIVPVQDYKKCNLFIKNCRPDGTIIEYRKWNLPEFKTDMWIDIPQGDVIIVNLDGYTSNYRFTNEGNTELGHYECLELANLYTKSDNDSVDDGGTTMFFYEHDNLAGQPDEKKGSWERYGMLGVAVRTASSELESDFWSPAKHLGVRHTHYFCKAYGWGFAIDYNHTGFRFNKEAANSLDTLAGMADDIVWLDKKVSKHRMNVGEIGLEIYQRVRLVPGGMFHKGWHWDLGVYGSWGFSAYKLAGAHNGDIANSRKEVVRGLDFMEDYRWNWGVTTRITRDWLGLYVRYRMNGIGKDVAAGKVLMPRLEVGLQLAL